MAVRCVAANPARFIRETASRIREIEPKKRYPAGSESGEGHPLGGELTPKQHPTGTEFAAGFHPDLSWSHYRAPMRVKNDKASGEWQAPVEAKLARVMLYGADWEHCKQEAKIKEK